MFGIGDAINWGSSFVSDIFGGDDDILGFGTELLGGIISGAGAGYAAHLDWQAQVELARENREAIRENYRTAPYYNRPAPEAASADPVAEASMAQPMGAGMERPMGAHMARPKKRGGLAGAVPVDEDAPPPHRKKYVRNPSNGLLVRAA